MREKGLRKIAAQKEKEEEWRKKVMELACASLLPNADSVSLGMVSNVLKDRLTVR